MKSNSTSSVEPRDFTGQAMGSTGRNPARSTHLPLLAITLVSLLTLIVNCYPIIFCGKSFAVSTVAPMVYDWWPPLPGMKKEPEAASHGSDTGATDYQDIPWGFIESRSVFEHGEIPLWDRYSHAGYTLIGQGLSMIGDPLQLIVILGHSSAWAWDIKFLTAKFLFCVGFGWLIFRLLGNRLLALIYTALAAYCGAFFYINVHPVFFVFCYAPWILLSAIEFIKSERYSPWGLVWLLVNVGCFNAGHIEVAVDIIGGLNLIAVVHALVQRPRQAVVGQIIARMAIGTLLFLALAAPVWISFFATLPHSTTSHQEIQVHQLSWRDIVGVFDDLFYDNLVDYSAAAPGPGTSLLIFVGCVFSFRRWKQLKSEFFLWINSCAIVLMAACIFALIPASFLKLIPFWNRVGHLDVDLSYLLVFFLMIQSAYGFRCLLETSNVRRVLGDVLWAAVILTGLIVMYRSGGYLRPTPWNYVLCLGISALCAPLLFAYLKCHGRPGFVLGWVGVIILAFIPHFRFGLYTTGNDSILILPGSRSVLNASSPAIDFVTADKSGPFRIAGMELILCGNYSAVYRLEDIRSCSPLSNPELIDLMLNFPGFVCTQNAGWAIQITGDTAAQPLLNLLNVKYLLGPAGAKPAPNYRVVARSDMAVVENADYWPRAFFSPKIFSISSPGQFREQLVKDSKKPFVALTPGEIEKQPGLEKLETAPDGPIFPATHYQLLPNSTSFDVHAASPGIVCLTEGQADNFFATANGMPKKVLTVNRAFKGIYLDQPGDYRVEFVYRPPFWRLSCSLFFSALAIIVLFVAAEVSCAKKKTDAPPAPFL